MGLNICQIPKVQDKGFVGLNISVRYQGCRTIYKQRTELFWRQSAMTSISVKDRKSEWVEDSYSVFPQRTVDQQPRDHNAKRNGVCCNF